MLTPGMASSVGGKHTLFSYSRRLYTCRSIATKLGRTYGSELTKSSKVKQELFPACQNKTTDTSIYQVGEHDPALTPPKSLQQAPGTFQ